MSGSARLRLGTAGCLLAFVAIAFAARVALTYHAVFGHDTIRFIESDAWYHMRLVDATVRQFPSRLWFDPYGVHPTGEPVDAGPFFDWIVAGTAVALGLGSPSAYLVDLVGAYVPAVLGALLCVPVFFIGRELCSRGAGLWAAFIVAVVPGQTLLRSQLGYTDHHCAETLLSSTALMWVVMALDASRTFRLRLVLSAIGGVTLGCYLLTWSGGSLFVLIVVAATVASLIVHRLYGMPVENYAVFVAPAFAVAAAMVMPWIATRPYFRYHVVALALGLLLLLAVHAWGTLTARFQKDRLLYLSGIASAVLIGVSMAYLARGGWSGLGEQMGRLTPWGRVPYVREALPLLRSELTYPLPLWKEFGPTLLLSVIGSVLYLARPHLALARGMLLVSWTVVIAAATFAQVRFTYYLGANVAILAAFACDEIVRRVDLHGRLLRLVAVILLVPAIVFPLATRYRTERHKVSPFSDDWYDALQWLNTNTPEPFGDADAYFRTNYDIGPDGHQVVSAYGVLAWWDYGYFIVRVGRRVPVTNPRQTHVKKVASFLIEQNPADASAFVDSIGSPYVIVDAMLQERIIGANAVADGFFGAIALAAGRNPLDFCQQVEVSADDGPPTRRLYCFPNYYRSMAVRLYVFGGRAVMPASVTAISWRDRPVAGRQVRRLVGERRFGSYDEASRFVASQPRGAWRIASADPLISCVPLDAVPQFRQVFRSLGELPTRDGGPGPSMVQIYERSGPRAIQRQTR